MATVVVKRTDSGQVLEMNKLSFDRIWGPKGRKGGYELATEADKDEDGNFVLHPLELGLPAGKTSLDELEDDERTELLRGLDPSMSVPPSEEAIALTDKLVAGSDTPATTGEQPAVATSPANAQLAGAQAGAQVTKTAATPPSTSS